MHPITTQPILIYPRSSGWHGTEHTEKQKRTMTTTLCIVSANKRTWEIRFYNKQTNKQHTHVLNWCGDLVNTGNYTLQTTAAGYYEYAVKGGL